MVKSSAKESVGEPLILLVFYSVYLGLEILTTSQVINRSQVGISTSFTLGIGDIFLIIIPILFYLFYKSESILLRTTYLMACIPFLINKLIPYTGIKANVHLINSLIAFIVVVCLIRYINETFEKYKAAVLENEKEKGRP